LLIINTGNGKGKTTAAIGQIVRTLGHSHKVCLIQLFKGKAFYGEQHILKKLKNLDFFCFTPKHPFCFPKDKNITREIVRNQCLEALNKTRSVLLSKKRYALVVLDEFNIAVRDGFINIKELLEVISHNPFKIDIIITGRGAKKELIKAADLVSEMKEVKHPFNKGVKSKKGIEF
jgi:cob(I)alamin adenosyltransferase